jgi:hypothetical protein
VALKDQATGVRNVIGGESTGGYTRYSIGQLHAGADHLYQSYPMSEAALAIIAIVVALVVAIVSIPG